LCPHRTYNPPRIAAGARARQFVRSAIEVAFQQAERQVGVGEARNRVERAVERTVSFGSRCQALTLIRSALDGDPTGDTERHPYRYRQKRAPSLADTHAP
jgi:hypothetical protein